MSIVKIKDLTFKTFIPEAEIQQRVKAVAEKINKDLADKKSSFLGRVEWFFYLCCRLNAQHYDSL